MLTLFEQDNRERITPVKSNEWRKIACQADLCYNIGRNNVVSGATCNSPDRINLLRRFIMDILSSQFENDNPPTRKHRTGPMPRPLAERFWEKVDIKSEDECWEWNACTYHHGYGKFALTRSNPVYAHRVAYELTYGAIPDDLLICHSCDNRRCCNPHHLFTGTQKDNMQDCKAKGRNSLPPRPPKKENSLVWQQSDIILSLYMTGKYRQVDLGEMYGVSQHTISTILRSVL